MAASPEPAPTVDGTGGVRGRVRRLGRRGWIVAGSIVAAGIVAIVAAVLLVGDDAPPPLDRAAVGKIASDTVTKALEDENAKPTSAAVYQHILPSLVQIETRGKADADDNGQGGLGTGVIVNARGAIMTAFHVVDGASRIRVAFVDGTRSSAEIVSSDPENDIAVLQAERGPEVIVPAVLGGGATIGDEAYAVGHPLGYVGSITSGVISGLERSVETDDGKTLRGLIQFDAAVNPGNSGGPLLNRGGQVIGIVTALANPSARDGYFIGIGFAIPIGTAGGAANAPPK